MPPSQNFWKIGLIGTLLILSMEWRTWWFYLTPLPETARHGVVLYTTSTCPYCAQARALLAREGVIYRERNIESDTQARAEYRRLAGQGVPLLVIEGEVIRGYRAQQILAQLRKWQSKQGKAVKTSMHCVKHPCTD